MEASRRLHKWAKLTPQSRVLELAAGLGTSGTEIARRYGCREVWLTDCDELRLVGAMELARRQLGEESSRCIHTRALDMFHLEDLDQKDFDCVITEASLTHYPTERKRKFLSGVVEHCAPGQILLHEICLAPKTPDGSVPGHSPEDIRRDVGRVIKAGFFPETVQCYRELLSDAGYKVVNVESGPMRMISPYHNLRDEGLFTVLKIVSNLLIHKELRERVLKMRKIVFEKYGQDLNYFILRAVRKDLNE